MAFYTTCERGQIPELHVVAQGGGIMLESEKAGFLDLGSLEP